MMVILYMYIDTNSVIDKDYTFTDDADDDDDSGDDDDDDDDSYM